MNRKTRKLLIVLIDCIQDLNTNISMHIDNHDSEPIDSDGACQTLIDGVRLRLKRIMDKLDISDLWR